MRKLLLMVLALLLFTPYALADAKAPTPGITVQSLDSPHGVYAFVKQLYMNPLSSFTAPDGFKEYYEITDKNLTIIDAHGNRRSMDTSWLKEPVDTKAYESGFIFTGFSLPDISAYKERIQYTLTGTKEDIVYRIYLLDDEIWIAQIHKDSVNIHKQEYIWSIFKIESFDGALPTQAPTAP